MARIKTEESKERTEPMFTGRTNRKPTRASVRKKRKEKKKEKDTLFREKPANCVKAVRPPPAGLVEALVFCLFARIAEVGIGRLDERTDSPPPRRHAFALNCPPRRFFFGGSSKRRIERITEFGEAIPRVGCQRRLRSRSSG